MVKFIFKCAIKYVSLFALFLVTFMTIHSMTSLVFGLLSSEGFSAYFGSGLIVFTSIITLTLGGIAAGEYNQKQEKMRDYYLSTK